MVVFQKLEMDLLEMGLLEMDLLEDSPGSGVERNRRSPRGLGCPPRFS